jgi:putative ABC transport system permease protein
MDPGFAIDRVLLVRLELEQGGYDAARAASFYKRLESLLAGAPGVRSVSFAHVVPIAGRLTSIGVTRDGSENFRMASFNVVSPAYLRTLALPLLAGRDFTPRDNRTAPGVALVNETMARQFFAGEDAVGKNFFIGSDSLQVVGVVKDSRYLRLGEAARPHFYRPLAQQPETQMTLLVGTAGAPVTALPAVREAMQSLDPKLPILDARSMADQVRQSLFDSRNGALLAASFGVVALALAAVGLYGVVAYTVSGRTREIGIRIALGAERVDVVWMVVRDGLRRVAIGLAVGGAASLGAGQLLRKFLFGVSPADPVAWVAVAAVLTCVALAATWAPALRASRIQPLTALRHE